MKNSNKKRIIKPSVILLGFVALATQIILLREFLTLFNGNELVIGIILANWMLLTGFGAYLGQFIGSNKNRIFWIIILLSILAFLPMLTVLALHFVWYNLFLPGMMAGITHVFYYSLLILSPFCIFSGILFTLFAKEESLNSNNNKIGDVYAWESFGSLLGGFTINFFLIWFFSTFQSLFLILILLAIYTCVVSFKLKSYTILGIIFFFIIVFSFLFSRYNLDKEITQLAFPNQVIKYNNETPFGTFTIAEQEGQINYYENNILLSSSGDDFSKEESVHMTMVQHQDPKHILVFSGIISGILDEIVKYPIKTIDYVDVNPEIIKIAQANLKIDSFNSLYIIENDALRFLKKSKKKYDIVLINLPKPSTIQLNRYYTQDFYQLLKKNLNKNAVISMSFPSSGNYMNDEAKEFLSIIYSTLNSEFKNVLILHESRDYLVASDCSLTYEIAAKIKEKNISTEYVNEYYINDDLLKQRGEQITNQLDLEAPFNKDFNPVFYLSQIKLWMSHFNVKYWIPAVFILLFSGFFFMRAGIIYKGVFAAGFAGTTIEIILLLVFQIIFGYVYAIVGVFIMVFMGGLAFGAYYIPMFFKMINKSLFSKLQLAIALFAIILPVFFILFKSVIIHDVIIFIIVSILILVISSLTGALFTVASQIVRSDYGIIASRTYGLDLLGAATGALLFSIYIIPLLGVVWSIFITGIFNLLIFIVIGKK